jgi:hypothetical protein
MEHADVVTQRDAVLAAWHAQAGTPEMTETLDALIAAVHADATPPSADVAALDLFAAWLHKGGWVDDPKGCQLSVNGVDIDWRDCAHVIEHQVRAEELAAVRADATRATATRGWHRNDECHLHMGTSLTSKEDDR